MSDSWPTRTPPGPAGRLCLSEWSTPTAPRGVDRVRCLKDAALLRLNRYQPRSISDSDRIRYLDTLNCVQSNDNEATWSRLVNANYTEKLRKPINRYIPSRLPLKSPRKRLNAICAEHFLCLRVHI